MIWIGKWQQYDERNVAADGCHAAKRDEQIPLLLWWPSWSCWFCWSSPLITLWWGCYWQRPGIIFVVVVQHVIFVRIWWRWLWWRSICINLDDNSHRQWGSGNDDDENGGPPRWASREKQQRQYFEWNRNGYWHWKRSSSEIHRPGPAIGTEGGAGEGCQYNIHVILLIDD